MLINTDFPKVDVPNFQLLSKSHKWDPQKYQPMLHNEKIKNLSETLKPGTLEYDDFWDEMDYYCINGFQPKGMPRITGRHFYYLNFTKIDLMKQGGKKKTLGNPFYRDLDHWLFLEIESAQIHGYGIILAKPRRIGLSEWGALNANYELTFYHRNKIGICAGKDDKAQEFYQKLESSLNNTHPAYRNGRIKNNDKELILGYTDRINKQTMDCGIQSVARIKTMYADSSAFEGGSYSQVIFEEIGLFENLTASYIATMPCFMEGDRQFGVPLLYGTGGEIDKGAKGFKDMWDNHKVHNLKAIFVPANFYYPGDGVPDEQTKEKVSFFNYKTGVTNRELAKKYIEAKRLVASKSKDTYIKHLQSYPMNISEVFLKTKGGLLDLIKLQYQYRQINEGKAPSPILRGILEWQDTPEIAILLERCKNVKEKTKVRVENNIKLKFKNDENGTIYIDSQPINPMCEHMPYKPDIGACDSYDEEVDDKKVGTDKVSSLSAIAYRTFSGPSRLFNKPVGLLYERGDGSFDDDVAYENAVKFAVYWDMEILFEYTKFHIIRYFKDVGAQKYIRARPQLEETGTTGHGNKEGVKMTSVVKSVLTKCLKEEVKENIHKNFFELIILDLMNYGEKNTDISMTYGIVKIHQMDIFGEISDGIEMTYAPGASQEFTGESYYLDVNGILKIQSFGNSPQLQAFIPERDLDEKQYREYVENINNPEKVLKKQMTEHEEKAKQLGVDPSLLSLILKEQQNYAKN